MANKEMVLEELKDVDAELAHFGVVMYRGRVMDVKKVRRAIGKAVELIGVQDTTIRSMMGEFGDGCGIDGCGAEEAKGA